MSQKSPFAIRGVCEGFYGKPWSHQERLDMFSFMPSCNMNYYMYAPKDDFFHREHWREPYPSDEREKLKELITVAKKNGVSFVYGISPGVSIQYGNMRELDTLVQKCISLYNIGCRVFALLLDDIGTQLPPSADKKYRNLGEAHADLGTLFFQRLRKVNKRMEIFFCPEWYCGTFRPSTPDTLPDEGRQYLHAISSMPLDIRIFWTGTQVVSRRIANSDLRKLVKVLGRKVLIWENFHTNDYDVRRIHLGPLENRDKNLDRYAIGLLTNGNIQAGLNKIAFHTTGVYLADPTTYKPEKSWGDALSEIIGNGRAREGFEIFASFYYAPFSEGSIAKRFHHSLAKTLLGKFDLRQADLLRKRISDYSKKVLALSVNLEDRKLFYEIYPYIQNVHKSFQFYKRAVENRIAKAKGEHPATRELFEELKQQLYLSLPPDLSIPPALAKWIAQEIGQV